MIWNPGADAQRYDPLGSGFDLRSPRNDRVMNSPKLEQLRKRPQFLFVREGARAARGCLVVEARKRPGGAGAIGVGFTASRKAGNAVVRNRAKRRLREAARRLLPELGLPGVDYVLVARANTAETSWDGLLDDLRNALIRLRADLEAGPELTQMRRDRRPSQPRTRPQKRPPAPTESD